MPHLLSTGSIATLVIFVAAALCGIVLASGSRVEAQQSSATVAGAPGAKVVKHPPTDCRNAHYVSNREPLAPSPLLQLPIGSVQPRGWMKKQLELQAEGFHGHLGEISRFLAKEGNAWLDEEGQGSHGWEEVPYWLKGYLPLAYLLDDEEMIAEANVWIEGAIASQQADGWFGPRGAKSTVSSTDGELDLWPNMVMLFCLQTHYDATGDERVLDLMRDYFRFQLNIPDDEFLPPYWQQQRAADNLYSVHWLYNRTGEEWLLDLAEKIHRHTADWTGGVANWHNVNIAQAFGGPATFWQQSGDEKHLEAAERNWQEVRERYGQVPGGMFGADENARPGFDGPRQAIETCGVVEEMLSDETLLMITGNLVWADRGEDAAFNTLPATLTADMTGIRYLTSPNHVISDATPKNPGIQNGGPMFLMDPNGHRCCQHNFSHGWPYLAMSQWMATSDNGLAATFYGENAVTAKVGEAGNEVTIEQTTHYPFDETATFEVSADEATRFPLYLRVPGWCEGAQVSVNGTALQVESDSQAFIRIDRQWQDGDTVELTLPLEISVKRWEDNHNSASVERGPLTYSLQIEEEERVVDPDSEWPATEILPASPWNYGLVLDESNPAGSFEVERREWPENDMPWTHEGVPIMLHGKGKRIPEWGVDENNLVHEIQDSPVKSEEPVEEITLIPMGAARLRISAFPVIGDGPDAHEWKRPEKPIPQDVAVSASHCWGTDSPAAAADGVEPKSSSDPSIKRLTFWPHKGTTEWVEAQFPRAREVSGVSLYWFDDTVNGGGCAVPKSWRIDYRKADGSFATVNAGGELGVKADAFNSVQFEPVTTNTLRIWIELQPEHSAGILEWRIEPYATKEGE